jgi:TerC family integral membrane protein
MTAITPWHWIGFIVCVLFFLALDLGAFHRHARTVTFKEALAWSVVWITLAMIFGLALAYWRSRDEAVQFVTGYVIELSLSMDNILVIALIFTYFNVPKEYQHRLLFWGIIGALAMRGAMIAAGVALIHRFDWILYVFGAFLVFTGIKMVFSRDEAIEPEQNFVLKTTRKIFPVTKGFDGQKLFSKLDGKLALTPLALVLLLIETTDLIFALDSVPAVFAVTRKAFIVFTSNVFAILGLRSMYFLLAGAIGYFRYLKIGLSVVLVFMGIEMLLDPHDSLSPKWFQFRLATTTSLLVVGAILAVSMILSVAAAQKEEKQNHG